MKKFIKLFIMFVVLIFVLILIVVKKDKRYLDNIYNEIITNTSIKNINYYNFYDDYYIVLDNNYIYVYDIDFNEKTRLDLDKVYDNKKNYDIIYRNELIMYFNDYYKDNILYYEYYDILTYERNEVIQVGDVYE